MCEYVVSERRTHYTWGGGKEGKAWIPDNVFFVVLFYTIYMFILKLMIKFLKILSESFPIMHIVLVKFY